MAEVRTVRMSSESPVALIIFIVATVVLLVACYFLYAAMDSRQRVIVQLQKGLQGEVESVFAEANKTAPMESSPPAPTKYGEDFFGLLGKTVRQGLRYEQTAALTGFPPDSALPDLQKLLKETPNVSTIRELVKADKDKIDALQKDIASEQENGKKLQGQVEAEKLAGAKAIEDTLKKNEDLTKQVADKEKEIETLRSEMKTKLDAAQEEVAKAQKDASDAKAKLDAEENGFVAKLDANIKELKGRLAKMNRKVPEHIVVPTDDPIKQRTELLAELMAAVLQPTAVAKETVVQEGKILALDRDRETAYINLGLVDGVKNNAIYIVYETSKSGKRVEKGEVQVVKVEDVMSTVAIVKSERLSPIVVGDVVMVKPPEVAAKPVPKAAKALPPPAPKAKSEGEEGAGEAKEKKEGEKAGEGKKEDKEEAKGKKEGEEKTDEGKKEDKEEAKGKKEEKEETKAKKDEGEKEEKKPDAKEEGKKSDEEKGKEKKGKEEKKDGGAAVKGMMMKLSLAGKAIQEAFGATKNYDAIKAKADEIAEVGKMAQTTEGMKDEMVAMYKGMEEAGAELSAAAAKKEEAGATGAMKKIAGSCTACHDKFKK